MKRGAPPLRFLVVVVGGWVALRAAIIVPDWAPDAGPLTPVLVGGAELVDLGRAVEPSGRNPAYAGGPAILPARPGYSWATGRSAYSPAPKRRRAGHPFPAATPPRILASLPAVREVPSAAPVEPRSEPDLAALLSSIPVESPRGPKRWSVSAWALVREGTARALGTGGALGGSQAGARALYRLNDDPERPLSLSARVYTPIESMRGSEAALGIEWQPSRLPLRILAERRQTLGEDGRSAFSLLVHGGVSEARIAGPVRLDAYGQAGVVGAKRRDLFADGQAIASVPLDEAARLKAGLGVWGAAQPSAARLDIGPSASYRLPVEGANLRLGLDWRMRVAGDATPGSGPVLTLSAGF